MSSNFALNPIRYGEEDGTVTVFDVGDEVDLDEDALDELRASGSIGDKPTDPQKLVDENARLKSEIDRLTAELNSATNQQGGTNPTTIGQPLDVVGQPVDVTKLPSEDNSDEEV